LESGAWERVVAERQVSVCGKGTLQGGRGNVDGLAIEESMGDGFDATAFGGVEDIVQWIRVSDQDLIRMPGVDETGLQRRLLVGGQTEDVRVGTRPQPAAWSHEQMASTATMAAATAVDVVVGPSLSSR
jgi:hypothetical protein